MQQADVKLPQKYLTAHNLLKYSCPINYFWKQMVEIFPPTIKYEQSENLNVNCKVPVKGSIQVSGDNYEK